MIAGWAANDNEIVCHLIILSTTPRSEKSIQEYFSYYLPNYYLKVKEQTDVSPSSKAGYLLVMIVGEKAVIRWRIVVVHVLFFRIGALTCAVGFVVERCLSFSWSEPIDLVARDLWNNFGTFFDCLRRSHILRKWSF